MKTARTFLALAVLATNAGAFAAAHTGAPMPGATGTALTATAGAASLDRIDKTFFEKAAAGGMFEVEAGKLAQQKGQDAKVKAYGAMLVNDHAAANDELKALAAKKGVTLPTALSRDMQKKLDKLGKEKHFDRAFMKDVGQHDHKKDISLFEKTAGKSMDADVKAFAMKTLPTLQSHQKQADALAREVKDSKRASK